jgi:hypothetical protein
MQKEDFPAIYIAASECSAKAQAQFFLALRLELVLLLVSAVIPLLGISHWSIALLQVVVLIAALTCTLFLRQGKDKPDRIWYQARALAESIKTMTWRYVSKAEPYTADVAGADVDRAFLENLKQLEKDNQLPARYRPLSANEDSITKTMRKLRAAPRDERKKYYLEHRIDDQLQWYERKCRINNRLAYRFNIAVVACYAVAIVLAMTRIQFPAVQGLQTGVFITAAVVVMSWMQAKRFSELAASYSQTGSDIKHVKEVMKADDREGNMNSDQAFSSFVGDAENAFSREHTQWIARRDS